MASDKKSARIIDKRTNQKAISTGTALYAQMRKDITKAGILERSYSYYTKLILFDLAGFALSIYAVFAAQTISSVILFSAILAFFSVQVAGLLHDAGHRAIAKTTLMNDLLGTLFGGVLAMSFDQWKIKHNLHHKAPNQEDEDPDVELPILSFSEERYLSKTGINRFLRKYQVYLYYPMGLLVVFSSRLSNFNRYRRNARLEDWWRIVLFAVGVFVWFVMPFYWFPLDKAVIFNVVFNGVAGFYLLNVFAPNHKGMPYLKKGVKLSFMEHQIITTRNIEGNWLNDFIYMGLNYQMEHHLFPNCPRNNLKHITPYLLAACKKLRLEYTETGAIESNKIILAELRSIAANGEKMLQAQNKRN